MFSLGFAAARALPLGHTADDDDAPRRCTARYCRRRYAPPVTWVSGVNVLYWLSAVGSYELLNLYHKSILFKWLK